MSRQEKSTEKEGFTRRQFIHQAGSAAAALTVARASAAPVSGKTAGANERIGVGFIGCGSRAGSHMKAVHWLGTQAKEAVELVAACDVYRPRLQKAIDAYGVKGYMDHRELLEDPNVDAVCIATCDHQHGYQVIDAVRAGKDVYCEKPVTHWRQFELTKKVAEEVEKSGQVFQLGTQGMSDSAWTQMKKLVEEGLIGRPIHAECGFFRVGDWGERGMPVDDPDVRPGPDLNWQAFLGDAPQRPFNVSRFFRWRMYEDYAGGPSTDLYPHSLTPVVDILGLSFPSKVVATGGKFRYHEREVPDTFNILVDYPEKVTVAVLGTQGNDDQGRGFRGSGKRVPVIRGWEGSLTVEDNQIVFRGAKGSNKEGKTFDIEHGEGLVDYWREFFDCCRRHRKKTLSPMELAFHVQTVLQMAMLGFRADKVARFDAAHLKIIL